MDRRRERQVDEVIWTKREDIIGGQTMHTHHLPLRIKIHFGHC